MHHAILVCSFPQSVTCWRVGTGSSKLELITFSLRRTLENTGNILYPAFLEIALNGLFRQTSIHLTLNLSMFEPNLLHPNFYQIVIHTSLLPSFDNDAKRNVYITDSLLSFSRKNDRGWKHLSICPFVWHTLSHLSAQ